MQSLSNMAATDIFVSESLIFKKCSPLKLYGQLKQNLIKSIYGRSSIKIAHIVLFLCKYCPCRPDPLTNMPATVNYRF
jgi:hypothetical protein